MAGEAQVYGVMNTMVNNALAGHREKEAREENYMYGERAAEAANKRTRALYNDLYSPGAQLQQLKDAGLSPSLFYGDGGGISGQTGAQGTGAAGISPNVFGIDPLTGAQMELLAAQASNLKADTNKIEAETTGINLQNEYDTWRNWLKKVDVDMETAMLWNEDTGAADSLYEYAIDANDFNDFLKKARKTFEYNKESGNWYDYSKTEAGMKKLREIYTNANRFQTQIKILSEEGVSAKFQQAIIEAMTAEGYPKENATAAVQALKTQVSTNDLTEQQKNAWLRLLDKLGKEGDTWRDIIIVIGMILNNAASNYHMPNIVNRTYNINKD